MTFAAGRMAALVAAFTVLGTCVAGATEDPIWRPRGERIERKPGTTYADTEADCIARRGWWGPAGASGTVGCIQPTSDAGRRCSDSRECEGLCVTTDGTPDGDRSDGRCTDHLPTLGCHNVVSHGRAWPICYD